MTSDGNYPVHTSQEREYVCGRGSFENGECPRIHSDTGRDLVVHLLSQLVVVFSTAVSAAVLYLSLRKAAREVRIRPAFEWARIALGIGGALLIGIIVGVQTPQILAIGAVVAGGAIGYFQGQQTIVSIRDSKLWAKRTIWGIALWSGGLIAMQLAGLGSRTGLFRIGQAISFFSMAVALGLILGRPGARIPESGTPVEEPA
ncbi:hypothetical protein MNBD_ACTINO02-1383 [hydrothermal vent metagenome]|uniref:Uncharacterized protein n=1 Tax=hydrothermal vent metagenome TaxID=652676 RepID=A0A3B0S727_9ZZZZ